MSDEANLPLAILLLGGALLCAFMAFRPWPVIGGLPVKPGAYAWEIAHGQPPTPGPATISNTEIHLTEVGLDSIVGLWAIQKIASTADDTATAVNDFKNTVFGWWGDLF
jgi:hypothetical protein